MKISEEQEREYQEHLQQFKEMVCGEEPNTFKRDHGEVLIWLTEELHKIDLTVKSRVGFDGEHTIKSREAFDKYRQRVRELRKKYGIED